MTRTRGVFYAMGALAAVAAGLGGRAVAWRVVTPPAPPSSSIVPKGGSLLICGGGRLPDEVRARFLELAGGAGARIVVIPTALPWADEPGAVDGFLGTWRDLGAKTVTMLHTRDRSRADDPAFLAPLREATGVWITGGHQSKLAAAYGGTGVERELRALVERGGVVAGTSAGAAIMTRVMIQDGHKEPIYGQGFDLLDGAVIDQHFLKRRHMARLTEAVESHPGLLGIGIDEGTALLVRGGRLTVLGDSYVVLCLPVTDGDAPPRVEFLQKGDESDLASLRGGEPKIIAGIDFDRAVAAKE